VSSSDVTGEGMRGIRPGREAVTSAQQGRRDRRRQGGERPMVPRAEFTSYYGRPVINPPVWHSPDIPGYFFVGGLAGASSVLAAGAQITGRPALARAAKLAALGGGSVAMATLVKDLGRPLRFFNMLRVFKPTSPMSVGSWLLMAYLPAVGVAASSEVTGRLPRLGAVATTGAAALGPAVAAYTATLISDTAVPSWHDGFPEMPFIFTGSAAMAAGGFGLLAAPLGEQAPARNLAVFGAAAETAAFERMTRRIGVTAEPYRRGRGGSYLKASRALAALGVAGAVLGRRHRVISGLSGAALLAASAATRWGVFHAGLDSAKDPKYTVVPQRQRLTGGDEQRAGR
jgi:polysulfide reductase-like protein